jgi:hypothetical protein
MLLLAAGGSTCPHMTAHAAGCGQLLFPAGCCSADEADDQGGTMTGGVRRAMSARMTVRLFVLGVGSPYMSVQVGGRSAAFARITMVKPAHLRGGVRRKAEGQNLFMFRVLAQWWDGSLVVAPQVLLIVEAADGRLAGQQGKRVCSCRGVVGKAEQMCSSRGTSCTQSPSRLIICISMYLVHMQNTSCDFQSLTKLTLCRRRRRSCSPASC